MSAAARAGMIAWLKGHRVRWKYITCDKCMGRWTCPYAYDPYNIGGDCLWEK